MTQLQYCKESLTRHNDIFKERKTILEGHLITVISLYENNHPSYNFYFDENDKFDYFTASMKGRH